MIFVASEGFVNGIRDMLHMSDEKNIYASSGSQTICTIGFIKLCVFFIRSKYSLLNECGEIFPDMFPEHIIQFEKIIKLTIF